MRGADGTAAAFYNVCRHRGARLLRDEAGRCDGVIRCPYHAWSYGLDGALRGAPNLPDARRERWAGLGLHRVALEERYGSLWVNLAGDAGSFDADIGDQVRARMGADALVARWGMETLETGTRDRLRRRGELEAPRRELQRVLPLRPGPPGADDA